MDVLGNLKALYAGIRAALSDPAVRGLLTLTFTLVVAASLFYHWAEGWGFLDSVYFSVITLATIGYGDLVPKTALGKAFTILYVIVGLGIFVASVTALGEHIARRRRR